LIYLLPLP